MLVLSRKAGEQIVLPALGVTIQVLDIGQTKVRLGIMAPRGTMVHRVEVWQRICGQQGNRAEEETTALAAVQEDGRTDRGPTAEASDLDGLADWIARRAGVSIPSLAVEMADDRVVKSGSGSP
jgi:carbon storage regulator CsrA